ncbi:hypothetical protein BN1321_40014 [Staphylococcus aureus]|uniref:Uncharacterized protein n=1 Tax=Staphylococcus aureus TaxID=1280 RepID=A0A0U1MSF8_STAAU|nr:hypothetical protein BN1321_40014 [Staphylococcus aureus]
MIELNHSSFVKLLIQFIIFINSMITKILFVYNNKSRYSII